MTTLVLGATGFIGSAVIRAFTNAAGHGDVIGFVRARSAAEQLSRTEVTAVVGDIDDRDSLRAAMRRASTVISCISYVGSDDVQCRRVNQRGMANVAAVAAEVGIERLVYVSTAAVYGPGPFRDLPVDGAPLRPSSAASRTRAAAEQYVRDVGGLVVRPHLVYGRGDRWFLPTLTTITARLGAVVDGGHALHSVIDVNTLARSLRQLSAEKHFRHGTTLHINEPAPRTVTDILEHHAQQTNWTLPRHSLTRTDALTTAAERGLDTRRVTMISTDHWFRSTLE